MEQDIEEQLVELAVSYYDDPVGFVQAAFHWGEGDLADFDGPDKWQAEFLRDFAEQLVKAEAGVPIERPGLIDDEDYNVRFAVASGHGIGKAQPKSLEIDTPSGRVVWGQLKAGDFVFGRDGKPTKIVGTYEQGERNIYRVTFDDGSSTLCDEDHIWSVRGRQERRKNLAGWRNMTTKEILAAGVKRSNGISQARQWEIPTIDAVEFPHQEVPIDPYTMGVWLGDGSYNGKITSADPEIAQYIGAKQANYCDITYTVPGLTATLRKRGWLGLRAHEKGVPDCYKYNTPDVRLAVLRGLMDTDGTVGRDAKADFCTTSPQLYKDFLWLARSLGFKAYCANARERGYKKDGKYIRCRDAYHIRISGYTNPFRLKRKAERWKAPTQDRYVKRWIESIEFSHREEAMCIKVEAEDSLYLTNDFIVTHNTALICMIIIWYMTTRPNAVIRVTANNEAQLRSTTWPELSLWNRRSLFGHWFQWEATRFSKKGDRANWYAEALTWNEANPSAFAGKHGRFYLTIYDEASGIPSVIWETTRGSMTTKGNAHVALGNPIEPSGGFFDIFHNPKKSMMWNLRHINSLDTLHGNSSELRSIMREYGPDHDTTRRRVLGQFPRKAATQFISTAEVEAAMERRLEAADYMSFPVYMGVDVARFGDDRSCVILRQGPKVLDIQTFEGLDTVELAKVCTGILRSRHDIQMAFVDEVGVGAGVIDVMRRYDDRVSPVNVGRRSSNTRLYSNLRIEIWDKMRQSIPTMDIPQNDQLRRELTSIEYDFNNKQQMVLEKKSDMKRRGLESPDIADALALTYARPDGAEFEMFEDDDYEDYAVGAGRNRITGY